ncbi:hypothetical protein Pelo_5934 [Pelomyxa schiedti]|nr:hypothetical protein Pelo_5934 [Pelomyxa schiedti]
MEKAAAFLLFSQIPDEEESVGGGGCCYRQQRGHQQYDADKIMGLIATEAATRQQNVDITSSVAITGSLPLTAVFSRLLNQVGVPQSAFVVACILAKRCLGRIKCTTQNIREIACSCVLVASKLLMDDYLIPQLFPTYSLFQKVASIGKAALAETELLVLQGVDFNLHIETDEYSVYSSELDHIARVFFPDTISQPREPASRSQQAEPISATHGPSSRSRASPQTLSLPSIPSGRNSATLTSSQMSRQQTHQKIQPLHHSTTTPMVSVPPQTGMKRSSTYPYSAAFPSCTAPTLPSLSSQHTSRSTHRPTSPTNTSITKSHTNNNSNSYLELPRIPHNSCSTRIAVEPVKQAHHHSSNSPPRHLLPRLMAKSS